MYTIKQFSTKKDVVKQLKDAGCPIKLPFKATTELDVSKNPFEGDVEAFDGTNQKINIK